MLSPFSSSPHGIYVLIVAMSDITVNILKILLDFKTSWILKLAVSIYIIIAVFIIILNNS